MTQRGSGGQLRSWDIISLLTPRPLWRVVRGIVRAAVDEEFAGSPLAVCWFVTFACNARCSFCCKAREVREGRTAYPPLDMDGARRLMERIRRSVDILYLSGGEPLAHPLTPAILKEARRMGFASVGMSTNGIALHQHPDVFEHLDAISVSIHSPSVHGQAASLGVPDAVAEQVFTNLDMLQHHARRDRLKVLVNCVLHEGNLDTVTDMVQFTRDRGFLLEVVPANDHGSVPDSLRNDPRYEAAISMLLELRRTRQVSHLAGSTAYYRRLRTLTPFRCFPYGVPNILPDGRLCTPCDVSGQHALNVLDHESLKAAVRASRPLLGAYPCHAGQCFKAGIVERSRLFGLLVQSKPGRQPPNPAEPQA